MNLRDLIRVRMTISAAAPIGRVHRTLIQGSLANPTQEGHARRVLKPLLLAHKFVAVHESLAGTQQPVSSWLTGMPGVGG